MATDGIPEKQLEAYYRKDPKATEDAILRFLKDSRNPQMIVYGAKAVNAYLPKWLDKETKDWDIFSAEDAKELAGKLEEKLDTHYGGDLFSVEPAIHEGTFRVKSKVTGETVADITFQDKTIAFQRMKGIDYATLEYLEGEAERLLDNPYAAYRHKKDRDTLQRIEIHRIVKKRQQKRRRERERDPFPAFRSLR